MNYDEFRHLYEIDEKDYEHVRTLGSRVAHNVSDFIDKLYAYMRIALGNEFDLHFPDSAALARAQGFSRRAWLEFLEAKWDENYVRSRIRIGEVHAQLQIQPRHYLATMNKSLRLWSDYAYAAIPEKALTGATQTGRAAPAASRATPIRTPDVTSATKRSSSDRKTEQT